jgi:DNA-binding transcriptional regulator YiaG
MTPDQFRSARLALGFSQKQLAETLGMGENGSRSVRRWEQGDIPVNPIAAYCINLMLKEEQT